MSAPKPFLPKIPYAKIQRLPRENRMTIVAGFRCADGIVLCADSEVTDDVSKYQREKIFSFEDFLLVSGAGATDYIKMAFDKLCAKFRAARPDNTMKAREIIEDVILDVYERHIVPYYESLDNSGFALLIATRTLDGQTVLIKTHHTATLIIGRYECIGIGVHLAEYWASLLYSPELTCNLMSYLTLFIVREVKRHVPGCGGNSHAMTLPNDAGSKIEARIWSENKILAEFPESVVPILQECRDLRVRDEKFKEHVDSFVAKVNAIRNAEKQKEQMEKYMREHPPQGNPAEPKG